MYIRNNVYSERIDIYFFHLAFADFHGYQVRKLMNKYTRNKNCRKNRKIRKDKQKNSEDRENTDIEFSRKKGQLQQAPFIHGTPRYKDYGQDGTWYRWLSRKNRKFLSESSYFPSDNAKQGRKPTQADT